MPILYHLSGESLFPLSPSYAKIGAGSVYALLFELVNGVRIIGGLALFVAGALAPACSREGRFVNGVYANSETRFRVGAVPRGYVLMKVKGASLALFSVERGATIAVNATCREGEDSPLAVLTNHLMFGLTERSVTAETIIALDHREALLTRARAKLDGVRVGLSVVVLKKDGCIYDFSFTARPSVHDAGMEEFLAFVRGFGTLPRDATGTR